MTKRTGGQRRKSRYSLKKHPSQRGKISLTSYLQTFKEGENVYLHWEPAVQKGTYHHRFKGKPGVITAKRGKCYEVTIHDGTVPKTIIVHPVHLRRV